MYFIFNPIICFVCYRIIIYILRFLMYNPADNKLNNECLPWTFFKMIYSAFLPTNMGLKLWLTKLIVLIIIIFILIQSKDHPFVKPYIIHVWWLIAFVYISCISYYFAIKLWDPTYCHNITNDYLDYCALLFVGLFAIKGAFDALTESDKLIQSVGFLLLVVAAIFYLIMSICYLIYRTEAWMYNSWKSEGSFFDILYKLNNSSHIKDLFTKYIFTSINISTLFTICMIAIYLIMTMDQINTINQDNSNNEDGDNQENKTTILHSLLTGFSIFTFILISIFLFYLNNYFDVSKKIFNYSFIIMILTCIALSIYRSMYINKRKEIALNLEND